MWKCIISINITILSSENTTIKVGNEYDWSENICEV